MSIKVSVIVPCYNVEKYLDDCLKSLLNQTLDSFEIICVNDGSTDNTPKLLEKYSDNKKIKIINQKNQGLSGARNTGVINSNGEYLTFIDSDDWVNSEYLEKLYLAIVNNNCDMAISSMIRKRPKSEKYRMYFKDEKVYFDLQEKLDVSKIPMCCYVCGKLFKRDLIIDKPFKIGAYFEDVLWTPYVIKEAKGLVTVPDTYYFYRVNNQSIVKGVQSLKKQHDSFKAKSGIIKFYEENNLKLNEKSKNLTKYIYYFLNIPILKVKEYKGFETSYLFGFLPVFKKKALKNYYKFKSARKIFFLRHLDNHIYINFLKLHLGFKIKDKFDYKEVKEYGLNKKERNPRVIVSLTTFPQRINKVYKTINTLLNQTLKPDKLILWLSDEQFKDIELPQNLQKLREFGLEIRYCSDLRSYKKLVPSLKEFPKDIIVTADDDLYYQRDWLESLYSAYLKNPDNIYTRRACEVINKGNYFTIAPHYSNTNFKPSYTNQLMGGAGTLYPPNSLYDDILDEEKIKNLIPTYDDIYFWAMAILKGTKIALIENSDLNLYNVEDTQDVALCKINNTTAMSPKEAFNRIFEEYPKIIDLIKEKE